MLEVPLRLAVLKCLNMAYQVSILVLLEVPLRHDPLARGICTIFVSILVLLEVPLRHDSKFFEYLDSLEVSILVLLEVPLRPLADTFSLFSKPCFNPCFAGSSS